MAFRVPTQAPRRHPSYQNPQQPSPLDIPSPSSQLEDESTQWVLFSPSQAPSTLTHTASTDRTPRTAGASRLSDFGSFGTATRSAVEGEDDARDEPLDEDGTELDSLDDGLQAFREPSVGHATSNRWDHGALLPAHDGLGSFQASSQPVQDQLWQYEQYNPSRRAEIRPRRRSSVQRQLDTVAENEEVDLERERWERIEKWRMDQSRALLHEIERETRRRRNSRASRVSDRSVVRPVASDCLGDIPETPKETSAPTASPEEPDADESFWQRITRKVIRDLIGIDDSLLSVLFGESLPLEATEEREFLGHQQQEERRRTRSELESFDMDAVMKQELDSAPHDQQFWQTRLLQRIARELGILVHQFCEHPGAFTNYIQSSDEISNEYAGVPLDRLNENHPSQTALASTAPPTMAESTSNAASMLSPHFTPTLRDTNGKEHAAHWGIEEEDDSTRMVNEPAADPSPSTLSDSARLQREQEYWEREVDVMMVFRYLRNRFRQRSNTDTANASRRHSLQDPSRRAAIIRQYHPLVARAHSRSQAQIRRQSQHSAGLAAQTGVTSPILRQHFRRPSSSCASQSAKRSAISSKRTLTGSSRNYWDIGGSVESGSAVAPVGGVATWGDV